MTKPIRPQDLKLDIPQEVINVINDLIIKNWNGRVGSRIIVKMKEVKRELELAVGKYDERWLNFETVLDAYQSSGWDVSYNQPSIGDNSFDPYYEFKPIN